MAERFWRGIGAGYGGGGRKLMYGSLKLRPKYAPALSQQVERKVLRLKAPIRLQVGFWTSGEISLRTCVCVRVCAYMVIPVIIIHNSNNIIVYTTL